MRVCDAQPTEEHAPERLATNAYPDHARQYQSVHICQLNCCGQLEVTTDIQTTVEHNICASLSRFQHEIKGAAQLG